MKARILTGWTLQRWIFLAIGSSITISGFADHEWILVLGGTYFAGLGLFGLGCAGGICNMKD
jgi:uncharacterized membrane protein YedE/YeeE